MVKQQHAAAIDTLTQQLTLANAEIDVLSAGLSHNVQINCDDFIGKKASIDSLLKDMITSSSSQTVYPQQLASTLSDILTPSNTSVNELTGDDCTASSTADRTNGHNNFRRGLVPEPRLEQRHQNEALNLWHVKGTNMPRTNLNLIRIHNVMPLQAI